MTNPSHETEPLVSVENLTKFYGDTRALDDLSFTLKRGEILGLLGANGAGKTTTLHVLIGLLTPTSGSVTVLGKSPFKNRHLIASKINFLAAEGELPGNLTVWENLKTFARLYHVPKLDQKISELLELFEITYLKHRITGALSSGERTRLNLVKCLMNDPTLLILDEPTASLDPDISDKVRRILKEMHEKNHLSILYTSHNMYEVETLCDRILFIHEGRLIIEGKPKEIHERLETHSLEQAFIKIVRSGEVMIDKKGDK